MLGRKHTDHRRDPHESYDTNSRVETRTEKGPGLARGPALLIGTLLTAAGLILFLEAGSTPTGSFPDGDAAGTEFLGFATNGWTAWFTTAAGALLLFGAAQHLLARMMSLLVGAALAACVVISLIDGDDVLGLAVANEWTQLGWGIPAALLLINSLMPRKRRHVDAIDHDDDRVEHRERVVPGADRERVVREDDRTVREDERVVRDDDRTAVAHHDDDERTGRFNRSETIPPEYDSEGRPITPLSRRH